MERADRKFRPLFYGRPQTPGGRIRARPASEGAADVSTSKAIGIRVFNRVH